MADLCTLFFSYYFKILGAHEILTKIVISFNYVLVGLIGFFGFWDIDWQFRAWETYLEYGKCFEYPEVDRLLHAYIGKEIDGARYMRIVRFITLGLFALLSAFYLYGMVKKRKEDPRAVLYASNLPHKPLSSRDPKEFDVSVEGRLANMSDMQHLKPADSRLD